ncbi:HAT dimerization domain-containing protein isoform 2 [Hibiscus syriacus]|uniref:HAT dimerization domain-containing protein isoform 2 n=1 Tax=Hibiscus syriacus TaxID=106335 RepID=A0A6A2XN32_HIBSY|nr:HAT dimerization domain-containing protein isoform 2 [Hibiscus syriacus]
MGAWDCSRSKEKKVKCNYCGKVVSGGIFRLKQHLARLSGEVTHCEKVPEEVCLNMRKIEGCRSGRKRRQTDSEQAALSLSNILLGSPEKLHSVRKAPEEVYLKIKENMKWHRTGRRHQKPDTKDIPTLYLHSDNEDEGGEEYWQSISIPSNAANSPYFHKMLELVGQYGQGLQGPSSRLISGHLLQEEIANIKDYLVELKTSWAFTGCSVMADSWNDAQERTLINFLVSCPRGVYFLYSVDATEMIEDAVHLFKLLDKAVDKYVKKSLEPVAEVLQKIGSDKIRSMPFVYNDICRAKLAIKAIHGDDVRKYGPFLSVIDSNWVHCSIILFMLLHTFSIHPTGTAQIFSGYLILSAKADFGTDLAISTRNKLDPGDSVRILYTTVSRKRLNDQTFVHYNLRLREHQLGRKPDELVSFDSAMLESVLDDWLVETEKLAVPEDEGIIYNEVDQFCGDDLDEHESEEKRPTEMVTIAGFGEPLDVIPSAGGVTTDDDGLYFLGDDLAD